MVFGFSGGGNSFFFDFGGGGGFSPSKVCEHAKLQGAPQKPPPFLFAGVGGARKAPFFFGGVGGGGFFWRARPRRFLRYASNVYRAGAPEKGARRRLAVSFTNYSQDINRL